MRALSASSSPFREDLPRRPGRARPGCVPEETAGRNRKGGGTPRPSCFAGPPAGRRGRLPVRRDRDAVDGTAPEGLSAPRSAQGDAHDAAGDISASRRRGQCGYSPERKTSGVLARTDRPATAGWKTKTRGSGNCSARHGAPGFRRRRQEPYSYSKLARSVTKSKSVSPDLEKRYAARQTRLSRTSRVMPPRTGARSSVPLSERSAASSI